MSQTVMSECDPEWRSWCSGQTVWLLSSIPSSHDEQEDVEMIRFQFSEEAYMRRYLTCPWLLLITLSSILWVNGTQYPERWYVELTSSHLLSHHQHRLEHWSWTKPAAPS